MRKITLLSLLFVFITLSAEDTNLLSNPGFENWQDGKPSNWNIISSSVKDVVLTEDASIFTEGTKSFKINAVDASGTYNLGQTVLVKPGNTYAVKVKYYVHSGDGSDTRLWCNYVSAYTDGKFTYFSDPELTATGDYAKLRSGNANSNGSEYLPSGTGWQTASFTFTAPANAVGFDCQFRTYKKAIVSWDDMSVIGEAVSSVNSVKALTFAVANGKVSFTANQGEVIKAFNANGQEIMSGIAVDGTNELTLSNQGVTIIRVGQRVGKVIL